MNTYLSKSEKEIAKICASWWKDILQRSDLTTKQLNDFQESMTKEILKNNFRTNRGIDISITKKRTSTELKSALSQIGIEKKPSELFPQNTRLVLEEIACGAFPIPHTTYVILGACGVSDLFNGRLYEKIIVYTETSE